MGYYDHATMMHYKLGPWDPAEAERRYARDKALQAALIAKLVRVFRRRGR